VDALFYAAYALVLVLAVHHFVKAKRGLRTGNVEGLMLGYWGKRYSRKADVTAFWVNVMVGLLVAALGVLALLWGVLLIGSLVSAYYGQPTL
jgi:fatty acid desaturase